MTDQRLKLAVRPAALRMAIELYREIRVLLDDPELLDLPAATPATATSADPDFNEASHLNAGFMYLLQVQDEISDQIDRLFTDHAVARTDDDTADHQRLALLLAMKLYPEFRMLLEDPGLLDLLFRLFGVFPPKDGPGVAAYKDLIVKMAARHGLISYEDKPRVVSRATN